ncbi:MAG: HAD family phosphatase [Ruminiclostridium sp.]|nr:HAD family phosphatase [Ruminiclostridium sp.]
MNFKDVLIVTDMDGTLLDDDKNIAVADIKAINRFRSGGGLFAAATGRGVAMAKRIIEELDISTPCVIFNGAAVYDFKADKFLWHSDMPDIADTYIRMLEKEFPDIGVEILHEKDVYVTDNNQTVVEHMAFEQLTPVYRKLEDVPKNGRFKVLIAYPPEKMQAVIDFTQKHCTEGVNWVHSSPMYYEMLPEGISKASGVKKLVQLLNFQDKFVVAAGDYGNDRAMIAEADLGVAVANALESVKEAADLIVCDNNHAPMSEIIRHIGMI